MEGTQRKASEQESIILHFNDFTAEWGKLTIRRAITYCI